MSGVFTNFINQLFDLPVWVQEAISYSIKYKLETINPSSEFDIYEEAEVIYQLIKPEITLQGKKELQTRQRALPLDTYKFLTLAAQGANLTEITINNFWTLEKTSKIFVECYDYEYFSAINNKQMVVLGHYLAGNIRLGEYLKRLGLTDLDQLEEALRIQKANAARGKEVRIGRIFTHMGIIKEEELKNILYLKEEAKKAVVLRINTTQQGEQTTNDSDMKTLKDLNSSLIKENKVIKQRYLQLKQKFEQGL